MISTLQAFLIQAAKEQTEKEVSISQRFDQKFKIRALTMEEWKHIQQLSTNPERRDRTDNLGMLMRAAVEGCVDPNYKDAEFLQAIGANTSLDGLNKTLKAGEIVKLGNEILHFSGFGESVEKARSDAQD